MKLSTIPKLILSISVTAAIIPACSQKSADNHRPVITVSIPPQKYLMQQIAGDSMTVNCLMESGSNPETYEPSIARLREVDNSDALLLTGNFEFETALTRRIHSNNPSIKIYDTSIGIEKLYGTHSHAHTGHSHHHEAADPHTWTSVRNARIIARNMLAAAIETDSANSAYYTANHVALDRRLDSLDRRLSERLAPVAGEAFIVWHPSLSYFARDYNLKQISVGQENKESSVKALQQRIDSALCHNASVFFFQQEFDSRQAEVINRQINARMVTINPMSPDWEQQINIIADALEK